MLPGFAPRDRGASALRVALRARFRHDSLMSSPADWNDLDRALAAFLRSPSAMPELLRQLAAAEELHALMPYHPELPGGAMPIRNGLEFPFFAYDGKQGEVIVPIFSSEARMDEALERGQVPPNTFVSGSMPGLQLLEIIGVMKFHAELNRSCQPGSFTLPPDLLRDLVSGAVFQPLHDDDEPEVERQFQFIDPADYPTDLLQPIFEVLRRHAHFRAAWIFGTTEPPDRPDRTRYELLVLMDPRDPAIFHELNLVAQNTRSKTGEVHLGHLPADEPERVVFMEQAPPPFYAAPGFKAKPVI